MVEVQNNKSRPAGNNAYHTVIASEAKQSRAACVVLDCFASLAMTE
jgi:hypothetical protein